MKHGYDSSFLTEALRFPDRGAPALISLRRLIFIRLIILPGTIIAGCFTNEKARRSI